MHVLLGIPYSPWTERARWALDAAEVPYRFLRYRPMLGEVGLRLRRRGLSGKATVPVLTDDAGRAMLGDSVEIARWAGARNEARSLFSAKHDAEIMQWVALTERGLAPARGLVQRNMAASAAVLAEQVPGPLPKSVRAAVASVGVKYFRHKYDIGRIDQHTADKAALDSVLAEVERGLGKNDYLVGGALTYADVAVATMLHGVRPVDVPHIRMSPALRACWTVPDLATRYAPLIAWRDELYARSRPVARRAA